MYFRPALLHVKVFQKSTAVFLAKHYFFKLYCFLLGCGLHLGEKSQPWSSMCTRTHYREICEIKTMEIGSKVVVRKFEGDVSTPISFKRCPVSTCWSSITIVVPKCVGLYLLCTLKPKFKKAAPERIKFSGHNVEANNVLKMIHFA